MSRSLKIAAAFAALALPVAAHASITVSSTNYGLAAPAGPGPVVTFDGGAAGLAGFTLGGSGYVVQNGSNGLGSAPADGPLVTDKDATDYLSVFPGTATLTSAIAYDSVSLFWGSIDDYNTLQLLDSAGNAFETITNVTIGSGGNGDQLASNTNRRVTIDSTIPFYGLAFSSTRAAFETDNIKFISAVPEPATWMMMLFGFGFMGAAMRKAKRKQGANVSFA